MDVEVDSFPTDSIRESKKGARPLIQGSYLPSQSTFLIQSFQGRRARGSSSGIRYPEGWWLSWEGIIPKVVRVALLSQKGETGAGEKER